MTARARFGTRLVAGLLMLLTLPFLLGRLDSWPAMWFDEGVFLHTAKNIALYGEYAILSGGDFYRFDTSLTTGPTVLVPIAALFRLFGVGLVQGRIISVVYALGAVWFCFNLAAEIMGKRVAVVATALMIWAAWGDFVQWGRFAMGEMPSLMFILAGLYLWQRSIDQDSDWGAVGIGVAFGLALLSKPTNVLVLGALLLTALVDMIYYRQLDLRRWGVLWLVALFVLAVWQGYQVLVSGSSEWIDPLRVDNIISHALASAFRPSRILANFNNLAKSGYLLWAMPGIVYFGFEIVRKKRDGLKEFFLLATVSIWLLWYVLGSLGWIRYAFVPVSISSLLLGRLLGDVTGGFHFDFHQIRQALRQTTVSPLLVRLSLALFPALTIGYGVLRNVDCILNEGSQNAQHMAAYLDANVTCGALVETWEWEISFLSQRNLHLPPFQVLETITRRDRLGIPPKGEPYSPEPFRPDYLIDGPWSKSAHLYDEYIERHCALETAIGPYTLYACTQ